MTTDRLPCLTALRGIAALCVLLHHFTAHLLPATGAFLAETTHFFLRSYLWVDFFFLLSGFLLAHLYQGKVGFAQGLQSYLGFLRTRLARIYPLHLVTLLAVLGLNLAMVAAEIRTTGLDAYLASDNFRQLRFYGHDTVASFFQHLLLLHSLNVGGYTDWNGPAWSIGAEWIAYVLFPFVVAPAVWLPRLARVACVPVTLGGIYVIERAFGGSLDVGGICGTARCVLEFWLGVGLYGLYRAQVAAALWRRDACLVVAVAVAGLALHFEVADTLAVLPFAAVILAGAHNRGIVGRWLDSRPMVWLGDISYSVYMTHWVLLIAVRWLWRGLLDEEFGSSFALPVAFLVLAAAVAVVLVLSAWTYRCVEIPWRRRLRPGSGPTAAAQSAGVV